MIRRLLIVLSTIALTLGIATIASAAPGPSGATNIGDFRFNVNLNAAQSDLRPGGHVRYEITATNTRSGGFPPLVNNRVLNTYGLTMPSGITPRSSGGEFMTNVGNHDHGNYWGGQPGGVTSPNRSVAPGSSRSGWLSFNIPANAHGGTAYAFGVAAHLGTGGSWFPTQEGVVGFTLAAVGTTTTVRAAPATLQEGQSTTLTANVSANHGSNTIGEGEVEFLVDGSPIGRVPVDEAGAATLDHAVPLLADREPVEHAVTARFRGLGDRFSTSTSTPTTVTVEPEPKGEITSTVSLTATRGLVEEGQLPITLGIGIDTSDGLDLPAGAEIEILRDGDVLGTAPVVGVAATFTDHLEATVTSETTYSYTARLLKLETYDAVYQPAESEPVSISVAPELTPDVTVSVQPISALVGRAVDITATLTLGGQPLAPGAEVVIRANGRDIGAATTGTDGNAILQGHVFTAPGEKTIVAVYEGGEIDGLKYLPATSEPATLTIDSLPEVTSGTVIELQTEATAGDKVTITAVVSRIDGKALADDALTGLGSVWFFQDGQAVGSAPVVIDPVTGEARAEFVHRFAERGQYRMTAEYSGSSTDDEVVAPSETTHATIITVSAAGVVIEEPGPPPAGGGGSLDLGSLMGLFGGDGAGSLASVPAGG